MSQFILYGLIGIVSAILLNYLHRSSTQKEVELLDGKTELRIHKMYAWIGYPSVLLGLAAGVGVLMAFGLTVEGLIFFFIFTGIFVGLGIPCVLYSLNHMASTSNESLTVTDVYKRTKMIRWDKIERVKFLKTRGLFEIRAGSEKVRLHQHLVGLSSIMNELEIRTGRTLESLSKEAK